MKNGNIDANQIELMIVNPIKVPMAIHLVTSLFPQSHQKKVKITVRVSKWGINQAMNGPNPLGMKASYLNKFKNWIPVSNSAKWENAMK